MQVLVSIYTYFSIFTLLISVSIYFQRRVPFYLKLFPIYLLLTVISDRIMNWLFKHHMPTGIYYGFFSVIETSFFFFILKENIKNKGVKRIAFYVTCLYIISAFLNIWFLQRTGFHTITYSLSCLLLAGFSIYYFYELFQLPETIDLVKASSFWIVTGILFGVSMGFPIYSVSNFLRNASPNLIKAVGYINFVVNFLTYALFSLAFICRLPLRKAASKT